MEDYPDLPSDSFICPISRTLMNNPVIAVDGHSYDEKHIMAWFQNHAHIAGAISPITGEILPSRTLIPNHALRVAIDEYYQSLPDDLRREIDHDRNEPVPMPAQRDARAQSSTSKTSQYNCGTTRPVDKPVLKGTVVSGEPAVVMATVPGTWEWCCWGPKVDATNNNRDLRRIEEGGQNADVAAIGNRTLRLYPDEPMIFSVEIKKVSCAWGGLHIGLIANLRNGNMTSLEDEIESRGWYLDGDRWYRTPGDDNELTSLWTGNLKKNDIMSFRVGDDGSITYYINGSKMVSLANRKIPVHESLYPFVSLMGSTVEVSLECQHPEGIFE